MTTESNPKETFSFYDSTSLCACSHQCWPVLVLIPNPVTNRVTKPWLQNFGKRNSESEPAAGLQLELDLESEAAPKPILSKLS